MDLDYKKCFNVFVGGKTGVFKGVNINTQKVIVKNIQNLKTLTKNHEITAMQWGDPDERDVLLGLADQTVKIYDSDFKSFVSSIDVKIGKGPIRGVSRFDESLLTGVESGHVMVWKVGATDKDVLETGDPISKMCHSPFNRDIIATGGKGNDFKLWNLRAKECTFKAKNVRKDMLELEVPIWISDIAFMTGSSQVAACSRYGHVRLYDPNSPQKRPVINLHMKDEVFTSLACASRENHVVVGSGSGSMLLVDLRKPGAALNAYKGFTGSIRSIACHKTKPYIVSVGLDRHVRVHDLNTKKLLCKEYFKSRLNCVLMRDSFTMNAFGYDEVDSRASDNDIEVIEDDDNDEEDEYDELFDSMQPV